MATSSFYNDNLYRTYPLRTTPESLAFPKKRLVGAKICCSFGSPFRSFPSVRLTSWSMRSSEHWITLVCSDGKTEISVPIRFPVTMEKFASVFSASVKNIRVRLTLGELSKETQSFGNLNLPFEPTCVLWQEHRGIRSIRFGNTSRDRLPTANYEGISPQLKKAYTESQWWFQNSILTAGPLIFDEGFNCRAVMREIENQIEFHPISGAGLGVNTALVSLGFTNVDGHMVQEIPDDTTFRPDGLPPHDRIVFSFCGATGREIEAATGSSLQIRSNTDPATVSIRVTTSGC